MRFVQFTQRRFGHDMERLQIRIDIDSIRAIEDISGPNGYGHPVDYSLLTIAGVEKPIGVAYTGEKVQKIIEAQPTQEKDT